MVVMRMHYQVVCPTEYDTTCGGQIRKDSEEFHLGEI